MKWETAQAQGMNYRLWKVTYGGDYPDTPEGDAGVREPRQPRPQSDSGGVALDLPPSTDQPPHYLMTIGGRL